MMYATAARIVSGETVRWVGSEEISWESKEISWESKEISWEFVSDGTRMGPSSRLDRLAGGGRVHSSSAALGLGLRVKG